MHQVASRGPVGNAGHILADTNRFVGSPFSARILPDFTILHELCMPIVHSRDERSRLLRSAFERSLSVYSPPRRGFRVRTLRSFQRSKQPHPLSLHARQSSLSARKQISLRWKGWRGGDSKERSMRRREGAPGTKIRFDIRLGPLFKIMKHN